MLQMAQVEWSSSENWISAGDDSYVNIVPFVEL